MKSDYSKDPYHDTLAKNSIYRSHFQFGRNADKTGSYKQVLFANRTNISPGDKIVIRHFISGYGYIDYNTAKIFFSPSTDFINETNSFCYHGIKFKNKIINEKTTAVSFEGFGLQKSPVKSGAIMTLASGYGKLDSEEWVTVFSETSNYHTLFSELQDKNKNPSLLWDIQTNDDLRPGIYRLSFVLTYFDGESWQNDTINQDFKVLNLYERNENTIKWLALIFLVLSSIAFLNDSIDFYNNIKGTFITKPKAIKSQIISKENNDSINKETIRIEQKDTLKVK